LFVGSTAELQKMLKKDDKIVESKTITPEETDISDK
jgi:recombinational DNA repair protein RecT